MKIEKIPWNEHWCENSDQSVPEPEKFMLIVDDWIGIEVTVVDRVMSSSHSWMWFHDHPPGVCVPKTCKMR